MKRFNPVLKEDDWGHPYADMEESPCGKYVLAEEAYEDNAEHQRAKRIMKNIGGILKKVNGLENQQ